MDVTFAFPPLHSPTAKDPDVRSSLIALRRAAALARKEAIETNTDIVVVKDGRLMIIEAKTLRKEAEAQNIASP